MISAKIVADSHTGSGSRLTTFELRYPRMVHAEFMTHRVFSRNASSSRAIPIKRMIEDVINDPAMPVYWGKNMSGMQAAEELTGAALGYSKAQWLAARDAAVWHAQNMADAGAHKQIVNRLLEPWMHISVVMTATDSGLANWFHLRDHKDAQPEIAALARAMWDAYIESAPVMLHPNEWHLPYLTDAEIFQVNNRYVDRMDVLEEGLMLSSARCARVSYLKHDGTSPSAEEDKELFRRLVGGDPKHASPTEHQAMPNPDARRFDLGGNFGNAWVQHRKCIKGEAMMDMGKIINANFHRSRNAAGHVADTDRPAVIKLKVVGYD